MVVKYINKLLLVTALSESNILFSAKDTKNAQTPSKICLPFIIFLPQLSLFTEK